MQTAEHWRAFFDHWPDEIERRGAILTRSGESIAFEKFLISPGILLCERSAPDASGARKAFVSFEEIEIVKLPTTMPIEDFQAMGFRVAKGKQPPKPAPTKPAARPASSSPTSPAAKPVAASGNPASSASSTRSPLTS